jgi:hypothetical protein
VKAMLLVFFNHQGIVHYEFTPEGQTANQDFYLAVLRRLRYEERDLKCGLREAGSSITIMRLLTQRCQLDNSWQNIQFLPFHNPPYSPDLSPPDFFLLPKPKITLKEDFRQWKTSSLMQ